VQGQLTAHDIIPDDITDASNQKACHEELLHNIFNTEIHSNPENDILTILKSQNRVNS